MNGLALSAASYNVLELCAGVGGLGLGIKIARAGSRGICYVERELYAAATLAARMEEGALAQAPIWDDLGSFDGRRFRGLVDCVASGDPCQPNSVAGKRAGSGDGRWLIDQVLRVVDECRPDRFFRENVTGNCDGQIEALVPALERMGYRVAAGIFSAAEVGASHKRERLFLMADREGGRFGELGDAREPGRGGHPDGRHSELADPEIGARRMDARQGQSGETSGEPRGRGLELADAGGEGFQGGEFERARNDERLWPNAHGSAAEFRGALIFAPGPSDCAWPEILDADPLLTPALGQIDLWAAARRYLGIPPLVDAIGRRGGMVRDLDPPTAAKVKSEVRRIAHGMACRLDRLRACGNGVFPLAAAIAWLSLELKLAEDRAARSLVLTAAP